MGEVSDRNDKQTSDDAEYNAVLLIRAEHGSESVEKAGEDDASAFIQNEIHVCRV